MALIETIDELRARLIAPAPEENLILSATTFVLGGRALNISGVNVTLQSQGAVLDAGGLSRVLEVTGGKVAVLGIDLINGVATDFGGCVLTSTAELTLDRLRVAGCTARMGGAVYIESGTVAMSDAIISDSSAIGNGAVRGGPCEGYLATPSICEPCPPGHWCNSGQKTPCPLGTHSYGAPEDRTSPANGCKLCPNFVYTTTAAEGTANASDCICERGHLTDPNPPDDELLRCIDFPDHLSSEEEGAKLPDLVVDAGFWRPGYKTMTARACPREAMCVSNVTVHPTYDRFEASMCAAGRGVSGAYCMLCKDPSHYLDSFHGECRPCTDNLGIQVAASAMLLMIAVLLALIAREVKHHRNILVGFLRISFRAKLRMLISFFQIVTQISSVYNLRFPSKYDALLEALAIVNLNFLPVRLNLFCFGLGSLRERLLFTTFAPLVLAAGAMIASHLLGVKVLSMLPFLLFFIFLLIPTISSFGFRALAPCDCFDFVDGDELCLLRADYEVVCTGKLFGRSAAPPDVLEAAWAAVLVWSVGMPLLYGGFLVAAQCGGGCIDQHKLRRRLGMLIGDYRPGRLTLAWEMVVVAQKIVLTGFLALYRPGTLSQLFIATTVAFIVFCMQVRVAPYRTKSDNLFAFLASGLLPMVLLFALAVQAKAVAPGVPEVHMNARAMGWVLLLATLFFIAMAVCLFLVELASSRQILVLEESHQSPKLDLATGKRWHIFLSHNWGNQDVVATIKRQLQLLLPEVEIFLDVDDLYDMDRLEDHVKESMTMIVMLGSKQYFSSRNCLKELEAAKRSGLPIIAVHEADVDRNGAPLDVLEAACPAEYRELIFKRPVGQPIVTWHRTREFQWLTLAMIGEQLLLTCPSYVGRPSLPLRVPGALAWSSPHFGPTVGLFSLYVSAFNPEASELGHEVRENASKDANRLSGGLLNTAASPSTIGASRWLQKQDEGECGWLLVLSPASFDGEDGHALTDEVHDALSHGIQPIVVYDADAGNFADVMKATPQRLHAAGLFKNKLAIELRGGMHRKVSLRQVAVALGARVDRDYCNGVWRRLRYLANDLLRARSPSQQTMSMRYLSRSQRPKHVHSASGLLIEMPSRRATHVESRRDTTDFHVDVELHERL